MYEKLAEIAEETDNQNCLLVSYIGLGDIAYVRGKPEEAEGWYRKSLVIFEELAEETGMLDAWDDVAVSCYKIGCLNPDLNYLRKARDIFEILSQQSPGTARYKQNKQIVDELISRIDDGTL